MLFQAGIDGITAEQALRWNRDPEGTRHEREAVAERFDVSDEVRAAYPRAAWICRGYRNPLRLFTIDDADCRDVGRALEELTALREENAVLRKLDHLERIEHEHDPNEPLASGEVPCDVCIILHELDALLAKRRAKP